MTLEVKFVSSVVLGRTKVAMAALDQLHQEEIVTKRDIHKYDRLLNGNLHTLKERLVIIKNILELMS